MDYLKKDLSSMIEHCKKLGGNPTVDQLQAKVRQLSAALENDVATAPIRTALHCRHAICATLFNCS